MKLFVFALLLIFVVVASEGRLLPGLPGPGPCKAAFPRYLCVRGNCLEYIYGGCGRDAGYRTFAQCQLHCNGGPFRPQPRYPHRPEPIPFEN